MPNEKLKIPDDLKAMYTMQKQVAHSFRDDDDVVKVAHRTQMLIERIARLEAENDTMALKNAALEAQLLEPAEQCENCDDYYAASVMQMTDDDVRLCPGCWEACCEETEG